MPISDDARRGKERFGAAEHGLQRALEGWRNASNDSEKATFAIAILAHVTSMERKLKDVVTDPKEATAIKRDAGLS